MVASDDSDECPACDSSTPGPPLLSRSGVAVMQNRTFAEASRAHAAARGNLELRECSACGLVFNAAFDTELVAYDEAYELDQSASPRYVKHVDEVVAEIGRAAPELDVDLLEIGSGNGLFLRRWLDRFSDRARSVVAFEPGRAAPAHSLPETVRIVRQQFGARAAAALDPSPNVVIARHVVEHLRAPRSLFSAVRACIDDQSGVLFVETPDVRFSLDHRFWHDFYYEHCTLFTEAALRRALSAEGFSVTAVHRVFRGEYLLAEARPGGVAGEPHGPPSATGRDGSGDAWIDSWRRRLVEYRSGGAVALWGAAGKGVTFASLVDPTGELVDCLVDVNPRKRGTFTPVTAHRIVTPADLPSRGLSAIVVMNDAYFDEIRAECSARGIRAELVRVGDTG